MTIIRKRPLLDKLVADGKLKISVVHHSYIVSVNVDGRLAATIAHGIILGPHSIWVCEEIH